MDLWRLSSRGVLPTHNRIVVKRVSFSRIQDLRNYKNSNSTAQRLIINFRIFIGIASVFGHMLNFKVIQLVKENWILLVLLKYWWYRALGIQPHFKWLENFKLTLKWCTVRWLVLLHIFCVRFAYDARTRTGGDDEVAFGLDDIVIDDEHDMTDDDDDVFMETSQQLQDQDLYDGIGRFSFTL